MEKNPSKLSFSKCFFPKIWNTLLKILIARESAVVMENSHAKEMFIKFGKI